MRQKVEIEVDVPDGWRAVAYRPVRAGEWYISTVSGFALQAGSEYHDPRLILEKVEPKRESRWRLLPALHSSPSYSYLYATIADAKRAVGCNHNGEFLRMERLDYEDGKLVAVTLEPEGEEA